MARKRRNLFIYLALACFLGIIAIFIFDGYMGIYDTVFVTSGEREQEIGPDVWQRDGMFWTSGIERGERAFFRYEVDNRTLSTYQADVRVTVWRMQEQVADVFSSDLIVAPFEQGQVEWAVDAAELVPADAPPEQRFEFTVRIERGDIERNIILNINPLPVRNLPTPTPG
jgi:hypothetical protein